MIRIKGVEKTSLIDYPSRVSSVVFLPGCNLRCPYCQNPGLINSPEKLPDIPAEEFFGFIESRREWIDGVCITGGEPTLHKDLPDFIREIKNRRFPVKLDTNGTSPEMLDRLISEGLVDFIAMDIKAPFEKYEESAGVKADVEKIKKSIRIIADSGIEHEFRTTILPRLHGKGDVLKMARTIRDAGGSAYFLQQFTPRETLDPAFRDEGRYSEQEAQEILQEARAVFPRTGLRGF